MSPLGTLILGRQVDVSTEPMVKGVKSVHEFSGTVLAREGSVYTVKPQYLYRPVKVHCSRVYLIPQGR